jgi:hypothetical protein
MEKIKVELEDLIQSLSIDLKDQPEILKYALETIDRNKEFIEMIGSYYCMLFFKNITADEK